MAKRLTVIPDADGKIFISCSGEIWEIDIAGGAPADGGAGGNQPVLGPPVASPANVPVIRLQEFFDSGGTIDLAPVWRLAPSVEAGVQFTAPLSLHLSAATISLADLGRLDRALQSARIEAPMIIDFTGLHLDE